MVGGSVEQQEKVKLAHKNGYDYCKNVLLNISNNNKYSTWFGLYSENRFNKVKSNYDKIKNRMETTQFTYDLRGRGCGSGTTFAYTTHGASTVWLCDAFWRAPELGFDSKAGTIVHEHSHASSYTEDIAYTQQRAKQLALSDPDSSINNADNYEYYSEE